MRWCEDGARFLGTLSPGEEVVGSLLAFARQRDVGGGLVRAIGAVGEARIGFYLPEEKRYVERELRENLEVVSLIGNLARSGDERILHAHVALGRADFSLVGGHLFAATVSVTLEVVLEPGVPLRRRLDPRFDLKLLDL